MSADTNPIFGGGPRTDSNVLEESGLLGPHRRWTNINKFEVIFLISALLAALVTDGLTIYRIAELPDTTDSDFAYGIIILVTSVFLLIFLATGIFQQRITDIIVFFICALMMTIYVIAHYVYRLHTTGSHETPADPTIRLIRLIFTCAFNVLFVPLSIIVIRDYERDEFGKRLFGAFAEARRPLRIYNILDCIARINAMLSISVYLLNLYNFNEYRAIDTILLCIGIPLSFLWLGFTIGMIRMESYLLVGFFLVISLFQPGFLIYCVISDFVETSPSSSSTTTAPIIYNTTTSNETELMMSNFFLGDDSAKLFSTQAPNTAASIPIALYLCMAFNFLGHIASFVIGMMCVKNFGRGLKEKVFNNRMDRFFRPYFSKS